MERRFERTRRKGKEKKKKGKRNVVKGDEEEKAKTIEKGKWKGK